MTTAAPRAPAKAGARPVKPLSRIEATRQKAYAALRKVGSYVKIRPETVEEGDVIATEHGTYCVVRKEISTRLGSQLSLRNVETGQVRSMKFDPRTWLLLMRLPEVSEIRGMLWRITPGDVVLFEGGIVAIRHRLSWYRTAAPWTPVSDAEVLLAVRSGGAVLLRGARVFPQLVRPRRFVPGTVVATKDRAVKEPSVWVMTASDTWVGNCRGAELSSAMIRHEISRGTYQILHVPESEK